MSVAQRSLFWLGAVGFFILALILFKSVLLPFVAGMAIAYFLDPVVDWLEAHGLGRALATSVVLFSFFLVAAAILLLLLPMLQSQLFGFLEWLPTMAATIRAEILPWLSELTARLPTEQGAKMEQALTDLSGRLVEWTLALFGRLWASGVALLNLLGLIVITPIVAWYLLRDWDLLVARIDSWLPRDHAQVIREQVREIDTTLAGFVRGQATVCLLLGAGYAISLQAVGLTYGLVVGLISGLISFIPYVGSLVGLVLSLGLAFTQFGVSWMILVVAAIFIAGQAIEGNFLTPKLVGERVGLHAVWVMFALLAGGALFGFVGMLLAVPVASVIGVLVRFALSRYLQSGLYAGGGRDG